MDIHSPSAAPTPHDAGEQSHATADGPRGLRPRTIGRQSLLILLEAFPGDISREAIFQEDQAVRGSQATAAATFRVTRCLPARVGRSMPVAISARVHGVPKNVTDRLSTWR